ncbi:helix-turn-helix transcriptional regulator [Paenalkalicoccus suaedae]|uniref:Helix-turn-helix transcriptional regulator n=1 Tax=Paenalkalicoccus suaedae TaxID=2592382 RepID=A0A859FBS3_9BACI|nr:helix-turn-helix transcriptional regulator [Paenalkalicoccus suaedae]QKS70497.1 helix-turn-helix transcriptional regulator [Paenalkalicoccus suaedae]
MLGQRIRTLRKQKKLTLEALAGDQLTKGMLSLIENEKSKPSMESLTYLAERLDVTVSELLDTEDKQKLQAVLDEVEGYIPGGRYLHITHPEKIKKAIEEVLPSIGTSYESARLLHLYAFALESVNDQTWQSYIKRAATLYENMNMVHPRVKIALFKSGILFEKQSYRDSLELFLEERRIIEDFFPRIDTLSLIDLHYHEALLYYAVGEYDKAIDITESALHLSQESHIFYRTDDFYRLAATHTLFMKGNTLTNKYIFKLKKYGELTDYKFAVEFYEFLNVASLIKREQFEEARNFISEYESNKDPLLLPWFLKEKGRLYYLNSDFEQASKILSEVNFPEYLTHPMDLALIYEVDVILARCHLHLGNVEKAREYAKKAEEIYAPLPESVFKDFMRDTLRLVEEQT